MSCDIQIVSKHRITPHGTTQLRCNQPAEYLRMLGYTVEVGCIYTSVPTATKILILHRVKYDHHTRNFIDLSRDRGCHIIYDTDDLLFDPATDEYLKRNNKTAMYEDGSKPFSEAMLSCDTVTVATGYLAERARMFHPDVRLSRNALSANYLALAQEVVQEHVSSSLVTIAYLSGSKTHDADFKVVEPALLRLLAENTKAKLVIVGNLSYSDKFYAFGSRFEVRGFTPYSTYADLFRDIDVNLIPLEVTEPFCNGKSELKYLEAGACAVVSIASPTEPLKAAIKDGVNGLLANDSEWFSKLSKLVGSRKIRQKLGAAARDDVLAHYGPNARAADWKLLIETLRSANTPVRDLKIWEKARIVSTLHIYRTTRVLKKLKSKMLD